ncbi:hypothetical protein MPTK1_5g11850 [Marchantia polymorpha subsp. ruderalis]|nr:hypothetical protein MARPO_0143s0013 [Marchantia polymorpha]BBN11433.1 hypothetical protein Mp_5g11850 [Marchantia polymorpha subsp. ruderalis]|eukprot:PTQ29331.1 hypothetical protein MARPO_0143s0013 [Marchantia polymorpha]
MGLQFVVLHGAAVLIPFPETACEAAKEGGQWAAARMQNVSIRLSVFLSAIPLDGGRRERVGESKHGAEEVSDLFFQTERKRKRKHSERWIMMTTERLIRFASARLVESVDRHGDNRDSSQRVGI